MNKVEIVTDDKYEAQKLASLIFVKEGNETFITEIIDVFETEIVISIKDKSVHSIVSVSYTHLTLPTILLV